jgi:hypothetical protein
MVLLLLRLLLLAILLLRMLALLRLSLPVVLPLLALIELE